MSNSGFVSALCYPLWKNSRSDGPLFEVRLRYAEYTKIFLFWMAQKAVRGSGRLLFLRTKRLAARDIWLKVQNQLRTQTDQVRTHQRYELHCELVHTLRSPAIAPKRASGGNELRMPQVHKEMRVLTTNALNLWGMRRVVMAFQR